jgi:hypothetical protein
MKRRCSCCGLLVEWERLPLLGYQDMGDGSWAELRNCTCRSTLAIEVPGRPPVESAQCQKVAVAP